jgi:hypothetical protein
MHASPVLRCHSPAAHLHIRSAALVSPDSSARQSSVPHEASHICSLLLLLPQIMELNESPVCLLLDPTIDASRKELPVQLHETGGGQGQDLLCSADCAHSSAFYPSAAPCGEHVARCFLHPALVASRCHFCNQPVSQRATAPPLPRPPHAELHLAEGEASLSFVRASYSIETSDAERIGVDQVAKILPGGKASGSEQCECPLSPAGCCCKVGVCMPVSHLFLFSAALGFARLLRIYTHSHQLNTAPSPGTCTLQRMPADAPTHPFSSLSQITLSLAAPAVTAHLAGMHSATKMLAGRITMLVQLLHHIQAGEVEAPHGLLRQLAGLVHSLPALDSSALHADYLRVSGAALLLACCAAVGLVCCLPVRVCQSSCRSCTAW